MIFTREHGDPQNEPGNGVSYAHDPVSFLKKNQNMLWMCQHICQG